MDNVWAAVWLTLLANEISSAPPIRKPNEEFCFVAELNTGRTAFNSLTQINPNSPWHCKYHCHQQGHRHASVEYGYYCGCATLEDFNEILDNPSVDCIETCHENDCMICGGLYVANFFTVPENISVPPDNVCDLPSTTTIGVTTVTPTLPSTTLLTNLLTTIPSTLKTVTTSFPVNTTIPASTPDTITTTTITDQITSDTSLPTTDVNTNTSTTVTPTSTISDVLNSTTHVPTSTLVLDTNTITSITPTAASTNFTDKTPTDFTASTTPIILSPTSTINSKTNNGIGHGNNNNNTETWNGSDNSTSNGNETQVTAGPGMYALYVTLTVL
ncbi:hepatitis A virus cellular receptor 1-like [Portunus trituberculatus]|uniref:hepatitis A virus cellular receptor 1-like n=1 Tax=Portunus trituberculatus TaxID=210409 RepID=UPI001E1CBAEA|nr:hepatitis A virus cellular receptor 1-like [Portunus trituberculatus]